MYSPYIQIETPGVWANIMDLIFNFMPLLGTTDSAMDKFVTPVVSWGSAYHITQNMKWHKSPRTYAILF